MYPAGLWTAASLSLLSFLRIVLKHLEERFSFVFCNRVLDINNYFLHFEFQLFVVVLLDESFSYCHSKSILVILLLNYQGLVGTEIMCSFRGTYNNLREVQIQLLIVFYMSIFTEYIYVNYIQKRILFWICKLKMEVHLLRWFHILKTDSREEKSNSTYEFIQTDQDWIDPQHQ